MNATPIADATAQTALLWAHGGNLKTNSNYHIMTEKQQMKLYLLMQNKGDLAKAREAYEFVMGEEAEPQQAPLVSNTQKDGVYLVYSDHEEYFTGTNSKDDVIGIGVRVGKRYTILALHDVVEGDKCEYPLLSTSVNDTYEDMANYKDEWYKAYSDLEGKKQTDRLLARGCKIPLKENEYIPAIGEWLIVFQNLALVQDALEYVGGDMLKDTWYWSSTECSSGGAWSVAAAPGYICYNHT